MTMQYKLYGLIYILIFTLLPTLQARQPYHATVSLEGFHKTVSAPNLVDLKRELQTSHIQRFIPLYSPRSATSLEFNLRGIKAFALFPADSSALIVQIPQIGTKKIFSGATREDSLTLFKDYIRDGGDHHKLFKAYARYSPIDPIAGNPNSLQSQMAQADYEIGLLNPMNGCECHWSSQPTVNQYQVGVSTGRAFTEGFDTTIITFPLRYSFSPDLNKAFIIDAPISYLRNGGASSVVGSLGIGFRFPIQTSWSLTPMVRMGAGGSLDLCTAGSFASIGLTSVYNYKIQRYVLSMTNYVGYFTTTNLWLTGVNFTYHLHNYIYKNGLSFRTCRGWRIGTRNVNFNITFEDTYFARDDLFIKHYEEIGISLFSNAWVRYFNNDCISLKFSYQFGRKDYRGYFFNLTYQF